MSTNHGEEVGQHSLRSLKLVKKEGEEQRQQQALGDEEYEEQNQHDDGPCRCQWGHLNTDRMKRTMKDKISMTTAPADVSEGTWTWTKWRELWRTKSAWQWLSSNVNEGTDYGQKEENSEWQNQHDDGPCLHQGGYLNMDRIKKTMNDKISMGGNEENSEGQNQHSDGLGAGRAPEQGQNEETRKGNQQGDDLG